MNELTARLEKTTHASVSQVWNAVTTPADLKKIFFSIDAGTGGRIGRPIRMKDELNGKKYEDVQ